MSIGSQLGSSTPVSCAVRSCSILRADFVLDVIRDAANSLQQ
ncbi:hypothetical protein [Amycolatopsis sp. NPDC003676]